MDPLVFFFQLLMSLYNSASAKIQLLYSQFKNFVKKSYQTKTVNSLIGYLLQIYQHHKIDETLKFLTVF